MRFPCKPFKKCCWSNRIQTFTPNQMNAINSRMKTGIKEIYSLILLHAFEFLCLREQASARSFSFYSINRLYAWKMVITKSDLYFLNLDSLCVWESSVCISQSLNVCSFCMYLCVIFGITTKIKGNLLIAVRFHSVSCIQNIESELLWSFMFNAAYLEEICVYLSI